MVDKPPPQKLVTTTNLTNFFCLRLKYTRVLQTFHKDFSNRLRTADIPRSLELNKTRDIA